MPYDRELQAALEAARRAGEIILAHYAEFEAIPDARADISTAADRASQEAILQHLRAAFPDDAFCAEEATPALADVAHVGPRLWVIDPIDGTRGFAKKNGEFSVMVAFVEAGELAVGVVLEPAKGRLTYAVRGGGCWKRDGDSSGPSRCHVSTAANPSAATLTQSHSRSADQPGWPVQALGVAKVVETYSAGVKLALVARGEADVYVNTYAAFHDWDIAAGAILVSEASGTATGLGGEELRYGLPGAWQRHGLIAANPVLHAACLPLLQR